MPTGAEMGELLMKDSGTLDGDVSPDEGWCAMGLYLDGNFESGDFESGDTNNTGVESSTGFTLHTFLSSVIDIRDYTRQLMLRKNRIPTQKERNQPKRERRACRIRALIEKISKIECNER